MSTILIVDDMAIFRDPISASLRLAGYQTITAANGKEALAQIHANRPDLILLDLAMPVMGGMAMLAALRRIPGCETLPVILLKAAAEKRLVLQAGSLGVQDYLLKSRFSLSELLARVKKRLTPQDTKTGAQLASPDNGKATADAPIGPKPRWMRDRFRASRRRSFPWLRRHAGTLRNSHPSSAAIRRCPPLNAQRVPRRDGSGGAQRSR
jgi:CheY-like chemotaxis protein